MPYVVTEPQSFDAIRVLEWKLCFAMMNATPAGPSSGNERVTEEGATRVTEEGSVRVTE